MILNAEQTEIQYRIAPNHRGWAGGVRIQKYKAAAAEGAGAEVIIPTRVTDTEGEKDVRILGRSAFKDQTEIVSVKIGEGVVDLEESAFENCTMLASITLPETLRTIGRNAFRNCRSLKRIQIPDGVMELSLGTFEGCDQLEEIHWNSVWEDSETLRAFAGIHRNVRITGERGCVPLQQEAAEEMTGSENTQKCAADGIHPGEILKFARKEWLVLGRAGDRIQVISCEPVAYTPHEDPNADNIDYNFHYWLNNAYYLQNFTPEERQQICYSFFPETDQKYLTNDWEHRSYTTHVRAKVSLLSAEEYEALPEEIQQKIWEMGDADNMTLRLITHGGFARRLTLHADGSYESGYQGGVIRTLRPVLCLNVGSRSGQSFDIIFHHQKMRSKQEIVKYVFFQRNLDPACAEECLLRYLLAHAEDMLLQAIRNQNMAVLKYLLDHSGDPVEIAQKLLEKNLTQKNVHVTAFLLEYLGERKEESADDLSIDDEFEL